MPIDISAITLLSAEEICTKLSISRSTFDRWRKKQPATESLCDSISHIGQSKLHIKLDHVLNNGSKSFELTKFPEQTLYVGGHPRWSSSDVNAWLIANKDKKSRRGFN
ncbi:MAG: hypothetical protein R8K20_05875 [Gallionellaceae bacterium]